MRVRHPERVARLILYGGYARGAYRRGTPESQAIYRAMIELDACGLGQRQPDLPPGLHLALRARRDARAAPAGSTTSACKTTTGEIAARLLGSARRDRRRGAARPGAHADARDARARRRGRPGGGGATARGGSIAGAEFVELDSRNHILLADEPAWRRFQEAVLAFAAAADAASAAVFAALSTRERAGAGADGRWPRQRGHRRSACTISEKTVRNHASNIFDKLGVWSRAQAIVFARDRGFSAPAD